jgi:chromosome segregation ATPase
MATVGDMEVEINATLVAELKHAQEIISDLENKAIGANARLAELEELVNSYDTTNDAQRERMGQLQAKLDAACQRERALETQIERENDLWVVWPNTQEMVQLRWHRRKVHL